MHNIRIGLPYDINVLTVPYTSTLLTVRQQPKGGAVTPDEQVRNSLSDFLAGRHRGIHAARQCLAKSTMRAPKKQEGRSVSGNLARPAKACAPRTGPAHA